MDAEKFGKWFRFGTKVLVPFSFFAIASIENALVCNAVAGFMTIIVIFAYVLEYSKIGDTK
jgi:hypothetical protein